MSINGSQNVGCSAESAMRRIHDSSSELPSLGPALGRLLAFLILLLCLSRAALAQPEQPAFHSPILPAFGGLSDGGPVLSPYIDRLAFNGRVDFLFLTDTAEHRQGFVIPYGFSFAVRHLVEGGIYTHHAFWKEGERSRSFNAPLGLNLKVRLWRWFTQDPNQHFTVVAAYQHEVRTGPFDGPNQLGLLTDLAALRIAASWPVWLFDIGGSIGVLYDYQGRYATGELGARLGVRLDFIRLEDTRASFEGILRGFPFYARPDAALPGAAAPQNPIGVSGALFFGVNTRMTKTADFGIWAQKGFGDVAPLSFGVRVLGIFIGEGYLRPRSVWAEMARSLALWVKEQVAAIDPVFRQDCVAYDKAGQGAPDGKPMGGYGRLSDNGKFCVGPDGFRAPVHVDLWRNPKGNLLCWDEDYKDCLLRKLNGRWVPIHRPRLNADCILIDSDGSWLAKLGEPGADKRTCRWTAVDQRGQRKVLDLEVGRLYHADSTLHHVCYNEDLSGCFVDRSDNPGRWDGHQQAGASVRLGFSDLSQNLQTAADTAHAVASGRVNLKTVAEQAATEAERSLSRCGSEGVECAQRVFHATIELGKETLRDAADWWDKPRQEKINDAARQLPSAELGMAAGGVVRLTGGTVERQVTKAISKAARSKAEKVLAKKANHAVVKETVKTAEYTAVDVADRLPEHRLTAPPTKRGNAPIGDDGHPVELHHTTQSPSGPLQEITRTDHRMGPNFQQNHPNTGQAPTEIDRAKWRQQQKGYWKQEWDKGRFNDLDKNK